MVELMAQVVASGRVEVTDDARAAVARSELSLVCVGTPSAPNGSQDQSAILRLAQDVGVALREKTSPHVIMFRSTLVPGTVEDVLVPILERASGKQSGIDFHVGFQPEFLREGSSIRDYDAPPFTLIGTASNHAAAVLRNLFGHLPCEFRETSVRAAEMLKYSCNNFHALKITFANETARLCEALGVDPFTVMDLLCKDRQLNISPAYLKPGFAFGGSCLPKDLRATLHLAKVRDVELPVHAAILPSYRRHVDLAIEKVMATGRRRIAMVGLSFKVGTDDLRESPLVLLAEHFVGKGFDLIVYDPDVHLSNLLGANRRFIEQHMPHLGSLIRSDLARVVADAEVLVVGLNDARTVAALRDLVRPDQIVIDLVGIAGGGPSFGRYEGLCW